LNCQNPLVILRVSQARNPVATACYPSAIKGRWKRLRGTFFYLEKSMIKFHLGTDSNTLLAFTNKAENMGHGPLRVGKSKPGIEQKADMGNGTFLYTRTL